MINNESEEKQLKGEKQSSVEPAGKEVMGKFKNKKVQRKHG